MKIIYYFYFKNIDNNYLIDFVTYFITISIIDYIKLIVLIESQ